jgi:primary-amine oxidase
MSLHPLEPLSADEIAKAVDLLKAQSAFTPTSRVISIILREPEKSQVYDWPSAGQPIAKPTTYSR